MQSRADLRFLELTEIAIGRIQRVIPLAGRQHPLEFRSTELLKDLCPEPLTAGTPELHRFPVLIDQRLQLPQVPMQTRPTERGGEVIEDHRLGAPLGLGAFTRVVHDEGIEVGHGPQGQLREAASGESKPLPGQPFEVAVLPDVAHHLHPSGLGQPEVMGEVVVRRSQIWRVVTQARIPLVAA